MSAYVFAGVVGLLVALGGVCMESVLNEKAALEVESIVNQLDGVDLIVFSNGHDFVLEYPDIDQTLRRNQRAIGSASVIRKLSELLLAKSTSVRCRAAYAVGKAFRPSVGARDTEQLCKDLRQLSNDKDRTVSDEAAAALRQVEAFRSKTAE